jgi:hypothetical protein
MNQYIQNFKINRKLRIRWWAINPIVEEVPKLSPMIEKKKYENRWYDKYCN